MKFDWNQLSDNPSVANIIADRSGMRFFANQLAMTSHHNRDVLFNEAIDSQTQQINLIATLLDEKYQVDPNNPVCGVFLIYGTNLSQFLFKQNIFSPSHAVTT